MIQEKPSGDHGGVQEKEGGIVEVEKLEVEKEERVDTLEVQKNDPKNGGNKKTGELLKP